MNYYQHHIGDFDSNTSHLSWLESEAYRRMMCLYYRLERPLPESEAAVCRLVRASTKPERAAVAAVLSEFFELTGSGWRNVRCDEEIDAYQAKAEKNREVGKLGGRPRKSETTMVSGNNPDGSENETQMVSGNTGSGNPNQEPRTKNQRRKRGALTRPLPDGARSWKPIGF